MRAYYHTYPRLFFRALFIPNYMSSVMRLPKTKPPFGEWTMNSTIEELRIFTFSMTGKAEDHRKTIIHDISCCWSYRAWS
jgi:hypothetical protein